MSFRHLIRGVFITLLAVLTALPFLAAPVNAAPAKATADVQKGTDGDVIVRIHNGSIVVTDKGLELRNNAGKTLETVPLSYTGKDARTYPIDAKVKGNVATLVASKDVKRSVDTPESVLKAGAKPAAKDKVICGPQTKKQRDQQALQTLQTELATAATIGAVAGAVIGLIIGLLGGPLLPVAGLAGAAIGAVGGLAGAAINGAFARYFGTINQKKFKPKTCYI
ncbi:hypothetical protein [Gordonia phthalatica]|uniref:DUF8020 domain-containing protein n=1 Tax=Gordonia phthalatica TaxID=1136941 RepID=A0A0N9N634_9ACTN|nr:hypothetical protein [Gordonia phthalatica]ALG86005.1 hypothetical protein ACH46_17785 [Gordonia phthalatica]